LTFRINRWVRQANGRGAPDVTIEREFDEAAPGFRGVTAIAE
jgi:hypothetical protein